MATTVATGQVPPTGLSPARTASFEARSAPPPYPASKEGPNKLKSQFFDSKTNGPSRLARGWSGMAKIPIIP